MFEKLEISEKVDMDDQLDIRQKIETALHRLQELRGRVEELKRRCEEIRNAEFAAHSQHRMDTPPLRNKVSTCMENALRCDRCGHTVNPEQQVVIRDSNGAERSHYHRKCFQALFK